MIDFKMPSLGADMETGKLVEWLKLPGDRLIRGDVIAVVETQKGAIEIEVFQDAVLSEHLVEPGTEVSVGTAIARLTEQEEGAGAEGPIPQPPPVPPQEPAAPPVLERGPPERAPAGRRVTPAARKRAQELGVTLQDVTPGADGIVGLADVEAAKAGTAPQTPHLKTGIDATEMRKAIAAVMARSKREIPHYYVSTDLDVSVLMAWLGAENRRRDTADRLLYAVPLMAALSRALAKTPDLNGHYENDVFRPIAEVHPGIAVSMRGGGLIAPALRDAHRLTLDELRIALADLVQRVRSGRLKGSEMTSATVTISNLGDDTADMLMPVIYPPQVAIIGCGQIRDSAHFADGQWQPVQILTATVAGDHRVSDGRVAARFLRAAQKQLDHPEEL